jgi:NADPH-dependent 7-cyano-7-deazaguanine reductase QueF
VGLVVEDTSRSTVRVTGPIRHLCPHRDEVDEGTISVEWNCDGVATYELHALAVYFASFATSTISHEELTQFIADELCAQVTTTWNTAGLEVSCSTSPTHAGKPW